MMGAYIGDMAMKLINMWIVDYYRTGLEKEPYRLILQGQKSRVEALHETQRRVGHVHGMPTIQRRVYRPEMA